MGVDWYPCEACGETFPDCGGYTSCNGCGSMYHEHCADELEDKYGRVSEEDGDGWDNYGMDALRECPECTKTIVRDDELLEYIAKTYELDLESIKSEILKLREVN